MIAKPVDALPEVASDLLAAIAHYESWRVDGREYIVAKYEETIGHIARNPELFPRKHGEIRRAILRQSYYLVYYLPEPERTLVLAVFDGRRNPRVIRGIISGRKR